MKYLWVSLICFIIAALIWTDHNFTKIQVEIAELRETQELMKEESDDCIQRALETIREVREIVNDAFLEKLFIPVKKDVFIAVETREKETGMVVEIQ